MLLRSVLALAVAAPTLTIAFPSEDAYARTLTSIKAGVRCSYRSAPRGVFVGSFHGYEESKFNFTDVGRDFHTQRCFATYTECDNWLYTMLSKYSVGAPQARCRYKG